MRRVVVLSLLCLLLVGCVGPNKLKRTLDVKANQRYQEHPVLHQALFPFSLILNHLAILGDMLIINPTYWWKDALRGEGTTYDFQRRDVTEPEDG